MTLEERFWSKVDRTGGPDACWPWLAAKNPDGYGWFHYIDGPTGAHRVAFVLVMGPIPEGKELDHLCHTADGTCVGGLRCPHRCCVNPRHMEPVQPVENWRRGLAPAVLLAASATKRTAAACHRGHSMEDAYYYNGARRCRTCHLGGQRRNQTTPAFRAKRQARKEAARCQPAAA